MVNGVSFGFPELNRLLHIDGGEAYLNDGIIDVTGSILNEAGGDYWVFQEQLVKKYNRGG